jgi:hypothetical protein
MHTDNTREPIIVLLKTYTKDLFAYTITKIGRKEIAEDNKNMQLRMHVILCSGCRNYMKQTKTIDELLDKKFSSFVAREDTTELEASIIDNLLKNI